MKERKPNHLQGENSPYLLQHAYNPVDWHPWGFFATGKARAENKLIVVSIGYAACHWCHVMEHESFEDDEVAKVMNQFFVSIKVDREERPDLDTVYMAAAYATTGRGGWPLNVITLPDQLPVFGGTYFRKKDWLYILDYYAKLWNEHPEELVYQASQIAGGMNRHFRVPVTSDNQVIPKDFTTGMFDKIRDEFDPKYGGSLGAPKFPMPLLIEFLLDFGLKSGNQEALDHVKITLDNMGAGGIYDHIGGGFCRYSVDERWHTPHFEKMLYDNGQLLSLYAHGFQFDPKLRWKWLAEETIAFAERELMRPDGLFMASLDADSDGTEGAFYTWTSEELHQVLGESAPEFMRIFGCSGDLHAESGGYIIHRPENSATGHTGYDDLRIKTWLDKLFAARTMRIRPATDDKVLTGWNGLMITGLVDAGLAFGSEKYLEMASRAADFYLTTIKLRDGMLWRNARGGELTGEAFLDDYSLMAAAFLDLYQATFLQKWLDGATQLVQFAKDHFTAGDGPFFTLVSKESQSLIAQPIELSDNVIASSNAVMAHNLLILGSIVEDQNMVERSEKMLAAMVPSIRANPAFHAHWARLALISGENLITVKIFGTHPELIRRPLYHVRIPGSVWMHRSEPAPAEGRIVVCHGATCLAPVADPEELENLLRGVLGLRENHRVSDSLFSPRH